MYFTNLGSGRVLTDNDFNEFEIAEVDKIYLKADIINHGNYLETYNYQLENPKFIRYAWSDTAKAMLFNFEGLPASSFTNEK